MKFTSNILLFGTAASFRNSITCCGFVTHPSSLRASLLDGINKAAYGALVGSSALDEWDLRRLGLPTRFGGFALPLASTRAPVAHIGSLVDAHQLVTQILGPGFENSLRCHYDNLLSSFYMHANITPSLQIDSSYLLTLNRGSQSRLANVFDLHECSRVLNGLLTVAHNNHRAKCFAFAIGPSNALWVDFIPHQGGGHKLLASDEFRLAFKLALGKPVFLQEGPCNSCKGHSDRFGMHAISCPGGGVMNADIRHDRVVKVFFDATVGTAHKASLEVPHLLATHPELKPADCLLPNFLGTTSAAVDMTIVSLGPTLVPEDFLSACEGKANRFFDLLRDRLVLAPGSSFSVAANRKIDAVDALCRNNHLLFKVFGVGAFGGFNDEAIELVRFIANHRALQDDVDPAIAARRIFMDISLVLQRAHATACLYRGCDTDTMLY
jgi:hypothetical protein